MRYILILLIFLTSASGCTSFMHGYTWDKAQNVYYLVTGDKDNFGDKRIKYNMGFHSNSELSNFLNCNCNQRGRPDFIYEYRSENKCRGIKLYYTKLDSVFVFEEPGKGRLKSVLKDSRKMDEFERLTFVQLKEKGN